MKSLEDLVQDWGGFERLIADLHDTGTVTVEHDVVLTGRSGRASGARARCPRKRYHPDERSPSGLKRERMTSPRLLQDTDVVSRWKRSSRRTWPVR